MPPQDLSFEPLYLLVPDHASREAGSAAEAAFRTAERFAGGRTVILIDLDLERRELSRRAGAADAEGIGDVLEFGLSLEAASIPLASGARLVPTGAFRSSLEELASHRGWSKVVRSAARRGVRILAYTPEGAHLAPLAAHAGAALLLTSPDNEPRLRAQLPSDLPVVGTFEPPPASTEWGDEPVAQVAPRQIPFAAPAPPAVDEAAPAPPAAPPAEEHPAAPPVQPAVSEEPDETAAVPTEQLPEPPMHAPTARGLTLAEWLAEEQTHLRSLEEVPAAEQVTGRASGAPDLSAPPSAPAARESEVAGVPFEIRITRAAPAQADEPEISRPEAFVSAPDLPPGESAEAVLERVDTAARISHRYSVPRTSPRAELLVRSAAVLILGYWTYYIFWRWTASLNLDALWFSVPLVLAETWGWVTAWFLVFTVWNLNHRKPPPAPEGLSVDVYITTYDEPLEVIRRTTISAREISYPHKTYVLDDGRREVVRAMARDLGVGYITRDNNDHAKAGNLNNALKVTSGDFVLQLDADHAPLPHILDRLLGFFEDERVAFVQTPQDFYNLDSFTSHVDEETQRVFEEQKLFFSVLQPGKDFWNSAFFCGSCAVLRRSAIEEIGGFSVESVTEDVETSMLLHARGWKSVYHGESLAYGLAASSAAAFHIQQGRWAQGSMQILRKFNPITQPGLSVPQRIGYFYSLSSFAGGLQKLIFYSSPLVFFFTGVLPIQALDQEFLIRFLPYLVLSLILYELLARGLGFTWIAERYQMAKFWTYTRALPTYLTRRKLGFRVTPKGPAHVPFRTYAPHIVLMVLTVISVYWATFAYDRGWVDYTVPGWESVAFQANFTWGLLNFILAAYVVRLSIRLQHQRHDHRFSDRFPIYIQPRASQGRLGERQLALTEDLNAGGLSFRSVSKFEVGTQLRFTLPLSTREVTVNGAVVHVRSEQDPTVPAYIHGVEFRNVPLDVRDAIEIHCTHHAVPFRQMQYTSASSTPKPQTWSAEKKEKRTTVRLPAWVLLGEGAGETQRKQNVAFLEEIGPRGGSLIMNEPVPPETPIVFEVPGTDIRGEGHTTYSHALQTPIGVRFVVGIRSKDAISAKGRFSVGRWLPGGSAGTVATLLALLLSPLFVVPAHAQFVAYGTAEADTRDTSLLLIGATLQAVGEGIGPYGAVMAYRLHYPAGNEVLSLDALAPSVGLVRRNGPLMLQGGIGYLLLGSDEAAAIGAPSGAGEGVLLTGLAEHAGTTRSQLAGSYNLGDDYVWLRGRGARPVGLDLGAGAAAMGAEVIFQGGGEEARYHSLQFGPTLELPLTSSFRILGALGWKTDDLPRTRGGGFPYGKLEFTYAAGDF